MMLHRLLQDVQRNAILLYNKVFPIPFSKMLLLWLISMGMKWIPLAFKEEGELESKISKPTRNYHAYSNWSIRALANQGLLIHPVNLPVFAEFILPFQFEIKIKDAVPNLEIKSKWMFTQVNRLTALQPDIVNLDDRVKWKTGVGLDIVLLNKLQNYVYANLTDQLYQQNLMVAIPMEHFESYALQKVEYFIKDFARLKGIGSQSIRKEDFFIQDWINAGDGVYRMRLRIPVRRSEIDVQMVRIKFIHFFLQTEWICSGRLFPWMDRLYFIDPEPLAFIKGQEVRLIYPQVAYVNTSHYMICDSFVCEVTAGAQETLTINHPCLSAIQRDAPVKELQDLCPIPCESKEQLYNKIGRVRPSVVEQGNKVFISQIIYPIQIVCINSSHNQILEVPASGAIHMRVRCGCELLHHSYSLLSRRDSFPPTCASDDILDLEIFQLVTSPQISVEDQENFSSIPSSSLESKTFYFNGLGHIQSKELVDQIVDQLENQNWLIKFIVSLSALLVVVTLIIGTFIVIYKILSPPWYILSDWIHERKERVLLYIIIWMDARFGNGQIGQLRVDSIRRRRG